MQEESCLCLEENNSFSKLRNTYLQVRTHLTFTWCLYQLSTNHILECLILSYQLLIFRISGKYFIIYHLHNDTYLQFSQSYQYIYSSHMTFPLPLPLKEILQAIISLLTCPSQLENAIYYFLFLTVSLIHTPLIDCRALFLFFLH